ncbi:MAG: hypothetical protein FWD36_01225 [Treponema sp.]|nr:hypothetical protein [Treponema sp.]
MKKTMKLAGFITFVLIIGVIMAACKDAINEIPALTGSVSISGTAQVGETLTANISGLSGSGAISYQCGYGMYILLNPVAAMVMVEMV